MNPESLNVEFHRSSVSISNRPYKRAIRISNGTEQIPYKGIVNKIGLYRKNNEIMRENMGDIYKTMNKMEEVIRND